MDHSNRAARNAKSRVPAGDPGKSRRIDRRTFLARSAGIAGAAAAGMAAKAATAQDALPAVPKWMQEQGAPLRPYGERSKFEEGTKRYLGQPYGAIAPGSGIARSPIQDFEGTITPSSLHFERSHNGVPAINPAEHRLMIHGLVRRPLIFTMDTLWRYPMTSRICFLECSGNSNPNSLNPKAPQVPCGAIHGLISCSEWTGVPLSILLNEAGLEPGADWILAEGADAVAMSRSVPLTKAFDDAMIALYQNGERLRPEQGYPVRLLLPGWEGNMSVKWLRRIKVTQGPTHTKDETSKYTDPLPDGKALQFTFEMGVKSVITRPSFGMRVPTGWYEISGLAWSGAGRLSRVEVSTDGGANWTEATLQGPVFSKSVTRFRMPWQWNGQRTLLQSRAIDEIGNVQPTRVALFSKLAPQQRYHNHAIQTWAIETDGSVSNVYL